MLSQETHGKVQYRIMGAGAKACPGNTYSDNLEEGQAAAAKASKSMRKGVWLEILLPSIGEYALFEFYRAGELAISYPELKSFYRQQPVVGHKEAAAVLGWDPRRVTTYRQRGSFPEPIQQLAAGPIWLKSQIEEFMARKPKVIRTKISGRDVVMLDPDEPLL